MKLFTATERIAYRNPSGAFEESKRFIAMLEIFSISIRPSFERSQASNFFPTESASALPRLVKERNNVLSHRHEQ
jgi:hypothetical protein